VPHKFSPDRRARLEDPDRLRLLPARNLLINAGLRMEMSVADVGCGPGVFTLPAAEIVGPAGRVYAIDISPEMLRVVREKARDSRFNNIETVLAEESAIPLPEASAQFVLAAFVLHEAVLPEAFARELARILAPGGHLLLLEWKKEETPTGGPPGHDRLAPDEAEGWLEGAGLRIVGRFEPNAYHYGLTALAPPQA
jgi:ubiquinone/menaquinone biosynthesis C-methylase UbiE